MIPTGICRWLFLLLSLSTWTTLTDAKEMRVVCYYTNWSVYRPGQAKFSPQNINPYLCTHLVYAFGGFTKENTLKPFDKYQDIEKGGYAKFTGLKTYNKNLKTLIAIGGWNEGSSRFSPMVASADRRKELVKNTIKFLRQNHFDGLDLDWEYPTFRDGGKPRDRDNYAQLVKELREEFERESEKTGRPRLLLTMAVPAGIEYINKGYDVPKLTKYLDWMNILSYDYHSAFEPAVNHHAPLYSLEEDNEYNYDAELNIDYTIKHYLKLGADPSKLVLGIPTYGRSYTLFNPDAYEIGSPADGPGDMGDATRENGYLAYYEICEYIKERDWEVEEPNPNAMGPIAYKDNQWVGYDDENIVRKKAEYVAENGLGGIMFWAIDNDDFRGNCHGKPYPLIEAAKEALINAYGLTEENLISPPSKPAKTPKSKPRTRPTKKTTTTEAPEETNISSVSTSRRRRIKNKSRDEGRSSASSAKRRKSSARKSEETSTYSSLKVITPAYTTPEPPPTPDMDGAFKCEDEGFYPHPKDCKKYFWCLGGPGDTGIVAHQFTCPAGLYFNKAADSCDYSQNVLCNKKLHRATTSTTEKSESSSQKPTQSSRLSTTRAPPKITAATSKTTINFRTTTTTTEAYEDEYEYDDEEDEEPNKKEDSEEDPRVIKELFDLIRKAGGIEQLEKQLKLSREGSPSLHTSDSTTPVAISKSLYERVLSKTSKSTLDALKKSSSSRNSGGPQNSAEVDRKRPQYKTLSRQRPSTEKSADSEPELEESVEKEDVKEKKLFRPKSALEYVNIRRPKASTTTEANDDDGFSRNKVLGELEDEDDDDDEEEDENERNDDVKRRNNIPQYVNIRRSRPSTTEASATSSKYISIRRSTTVSSIEPEGEDDEEESKNKIRRGSTTESSTAIDDSTSSRYQTIRRGTTTTPTSVSEENEETVRGRSTTTSPAPENDTVATSSTTVRASTAAPYEETNDSIAKYQTIRRETTTQPTLPTSEESKMTPVLEKEQPVNISDSSDGTTLPQESISNYNILTTENLISSTQKETTESNIDATSNASLSTGEIPDTETKKKRPVLFQPRPFSIGTNTSSVKSTSPEPSTTTPAFKVSQSSFKFRVRPSSSTTESTSTTVRSRTRSRYSNVNRNLSEDTEQEEKYERTVENKPTRTRKRILATTEAPIDFNEEYNRKYRPAEIADLSSLTAVDLNLRGDGFISKNRRRRPTSATSSTTTTEKVLEESEKTGPRTLTLARKTIDVNAFGRGRRVVSKNDDQLNASSDQTSASKKIVRGFRTTTPKSVAFESNSTTPIVPRPRKIIRKFRPGTSSTSTTEKLISSEDSTPLLQRKRIPLFRPRQSKINASTTTAEPVTSTSSEPETPLVKLLEADPQSNAIKNDTTSTTEKDDDEDELSNEHIDILNGEEGENIKLSESNIRESSHINTFDFDEKPGKRKFNKNKETRFNRFPVESTEFDTTSEVSAVTTVASTTSTRRTEPARILRTRKIIRKLGTTSTTEPTILTTTPIVDHTTTVGGKRKILRRLRPSNENNFRLSTKEIAESATKQYAHNEQTSSEYSSAAPAETTEEVFSRSSFRPSFSRQTTAKDEEEKNKFEPNKFRIFRPTTDVYRAVSTPRYSIYTRPSFAEDVDDDEDEDQDEEDVEDDDDEEDSDLSDPPKYIIYSTTSVKRTHKFESNTNFNDEDEEDIDNYLKKNKTVSSLVTKSAVNSRNVSETILDDIGDSHENNNSSDARQHSLLRPQKDRPSFIRHRLTMGKEEVKTQTQEDLLKTQPGYKFKSESTVTSSSLSSSTEQTADAVSTSMPEIEATTSISDTDKEEDKKEEIEVPVVETTENIDMTTLEVNVSIDEEDNSIGSTGILLTTTEEDIETTLSHITDEDIAAINESTTPDLDTLQITTTPLTNISDVSTAQMPEEADETTISNLTETTTEYRLRSTLRSVKDRPKLDLARRTTESHFSSSSTELPESSTRKSFKRTFGKTRTKRPSTIKPSIKPLNLTGARSTSPLPLNKFLYKYSTTERNKFKFEEIEPEEGDHVFEDEEENETERISAVFSRPSSTTPKVVNKPFKNSSIKPKFNRPQSSAPSVTEKPLSVDAEAVKNRNKSLYAKRKMNSPVLLSSTTTLVDILTTENSAITTTPTNSPSSPTDSTDPNLTTLHHIFAEIDENDTTTESINLSPTQKPGGKVERLIEVNRIVEVKTKQAKVKNHAGAIEEDTKIEIIPTVDKIGEISRITLIKIVDGSNETIVKDPESNEISTSLKTTPPPPSASPSTERQVPIEIAKVEEIPASKMLQNVNLKNVQLDIKLDQREERKYEIFGESKVANEKDANEIAEKPEIIDGISHINVVTPKPLLVTEASTISLQGLFQSEKPFLNPSFASNDEVLETGRSEFVNVRVLDQDPSVRANKGIRGDTDFVPVKVLPQDAEDSTIKAHVMEISPRLDTRTIKIVPIRVEMSRSFAGLRLPPKQIGVKK